MELRNFLQKETYRYKLAQPSRIVYKQLHSFPQVRLNIPMRDILNKLSGLTESESLTHEDKKYVCYTEDSNGNQLSQFYGDAINDLLKEALRSDDSVHVVTIFRNENNEHVATYTRTDAPTLRGDGWELIKQNIG